MASIDYLLPVYTRNEDPSRKETFNLYVQRTDFDPCKETILLLHGYLGSSQDYNFAFEHFSSKYNLLAVDLRGHGESDSPLEDNWEIQDFSYDIYQVLQQLLPFRARVKVVANSLSTAVALDLAIRYPDLIDSLFLISPTGQFSVPSWAQFVLYVTHKPPKRVINFITEVTTYLISFFILDEFQRNFLKDGFNRMRKIEFGVHKKILGETLVKWEFEENRIEIPVFMISGKNDDVVPFEDSLGLSKRIQNSIFLALEDTGHHILRFRTELVFDLVEQWVESQNVNLPQDHQHTKSLSADQNVILEAQKSEFASQET